MPNNKNILREKINEACPELLKLEFGCEVRKYQKVFTWVHIETDEKQRHYCTYFDKESMAMHNVAETTQGVEEFEILGKPPTLEHLLRTLKEVKDLYSIDSFGQIYKHTEGGEYDTGFIYDLSKPPLEQSEEVIEALLKIINA